MQYFLKEGGLAGHMMHLYDNHELTFKKLKEILNNAASGNIVGTEKTDGQNLFVSYSCKTGEVRAARNKGNIATGGLTLDELAAKFEGRGTVYDAFKEGFESFQEAVLGFDEKTQQALFGKDAEIFYNAEIMDPRNANVINYDTKTLAIHRVGHVKVNKETGKFEPLEASELTEMLENALKKQQNSNRKTKFKVQVNAIRTLKKLADKSFLNNTLNKLDQLLNEVGLNDDNTIGQYFISRLIPQIREKIQLEVDKEKELIKKLLNHKGVYINQIKAGLDPQSKAIVDEIVNNKAVFAKNAIGSLEHLIHNFAIEMLRGVESAFMLDNEKEVRRLRAEVSDAIDKIKSSGSEDAIAILNQQLQKLEKLEDIATAAEGFVFNFDGYTYKLTGTFAPVNQILGLFKYGRGNVSAIKKIDEGLVGSGNIIAIYPGAFKPPHRGHMDCVEHYADLAKKVYIFISPIPRKVADNSGEKINIGAALSKDIWNLYIHEAGLSNIVEAIVSSYASPVTTTFEFIKGDESGLPVSAQPGDSILLAASTKGDDHLRFKGAEKYVKEGVELLDPMSYAFDPKPPVLNATEFRKAIVDNNQSEILKYLPDFVDSSKFFDILRNHSLINDTKISSSTLFEMIEEILDEIELEETSCAGGGAISGAPGTFTGKKSKKRNLENE